MQKVLNHINATIDPMIDCMMTAICNDRPLPTILDDFQYVGDDSLFSQMEEFVSFSLLFVAVVYACLANRTCTSLL